MHQKQIGIGVICALVIDVAAAFAAVFFAAAPVLFVAVPAWAAKPESCAEITAACKAAGFVQGGAAAGNGLMVDCVRPILMGTTPRKASLKLPAIDPQTVAACKSANPDLTQGRGAKARARAIRRRRWRMQRRKRFRRTIRRRREVRTSSSC